MESLVAVEMESFCMSYRKKSLTEIFEAQLKLQPELWDKMITKKEEKRKKKKTQLAKAATQLLSEFRQSEMQKSTKQQGLWDRLTNPFILNT